MKSLEIYQLIVKSEKRCGLKMLIVDLRQFWIQNVHLKAFGKNPIPGFMHIL